MTVIFRHAGRGDLPALVLMLADDVLGSGREDGRMPVNAAYVEAFEVILEDKNQTVLVADLDGQVVGCLQLTFLPGLSRLGMWRGQIEGVRVSKDLRGQGLGKQMIEYAIGLCRERKCGLVQLTTDKSRADAHRFYEDLGFVATHEGMKLAL